jgi:hypothetical protein
MMLDDIIPFWFSLLDNYGLHLIQKYEQPSWYVNLQKDPFDKVRGVRCMKHLKSKGLRPSSSAICKWIHSSLGVVDGNCAMLPEYQEFLPDLHEFSMVPRQRYYHFNDDSLQQYERNVLQLIKCGMNRQTCEKMVSKVYFPYYNMIVMAVAITRPKSTCKLPNELIRYLKPFLC